MEKILNFIATNWYFVVAGVVVIALAVWGTIVLVKSKNSSEEKEKTEEKKETKTAAKKTSTKAKKEVKEDKKEVKAEEVEEQYDYVVSYDSEQRLWGVKKSNGKKALKRFVTKQEAIDYAKTFAEKYNTKVFANKKNEEQ